MINAVTIITIIVNIVIITVYIIIIIVITIIVIVIVILFIVIIAIIVFIMIILVIGVIINANVIVVFIIISSNPSSVASPPLYIPLPTFLPFLPLYTNLVCSISHFKVIGREQNTCLDSVYQLLINIRH